MALASSKASVALLILRIMGTSTWRKSFLYFLMAANFLFCTLSVIFTYAQCKPTKALWDQSIKGKCWKPESQSGFSLMTGSKYETQGAVSILYRVAQVYPRLHKNPGKHRLTPIQGFLAFTDLCLAILPFTIVQKLQLSLKKKAGLSVLLGMGIL